MPLRKFKRVYLAELLAILKTAEYGNTTVHGYSIRSDCKLAIEVLSKQFNINKTIYTHDKEAIN